VAVLSGNETQAQLVALAEDVFLHFGLGCRNVSKLFLPAGYNFFQLLQAFETARHVCDHASYMNNFKHFKALFTLQKDDFFDNGFLILKYSTAIASPVAALYYEFYGNIDELVQNMREQLDQIQCIVSAINLPFTTIDFGETQHPGLADYADGVDTVKFIADLKS